MDTKSAVASRDHLAKEEWWHGREHMAALVFPESSKEAIGLINFLELINLTSSF